MARFGKLIIFSLLAFASVFTACQQQGGNSYLRTPKAVRFKTVATPLVQRSIARLAREVNIKVRIMPSNSRQRRGARRLNPAFITIHSTANHSPSSTAMQHSRALCRGAFTNRSWHFTVDQFMCVQNLPLRETGWHAGTPAGNHNSIGIEMCECENKGHNHFRTWDRAAKLTAVLMKRYGINLRHVELPDSLLIIGEMAFYYCPALEGIKLPPHLYAIGPSAFVDCWKLTSIDIPETVRYIGSEAFCNTGLTEVWWRPVFFETGFCVFDPDELYSKARPKTVHVSEVLLEDEIGDIANFCVEYEDGYGITFVMDIPYAWD